MPMPFVVAAPASSSVAPVPHSAHYPASFLLSSAVSQGCPGRIRFSCRNVSLPRLCSNLSAPIIDQGQVAHLLDVVSSPDINDHTLDIR